jgi:hypothetical protein
MYYSIKIKIKYNFYRKITNNMTYKYVINMILYLFKGKNEIYSINYKLYKLNN